MSLPIKNLEFRAPGDHGQLNGARASAAVTLYPASAVRRDLTHLHANEIWSTNKTGY